MVGDPTLGLRDSIERLPYGQVWFNSWIQGVNARSSYVLSIRCQYRDTNIYENHAGDIYCSWEARYSGVPHSFANAP